MASILFEAMSKNQRPRKNVPVTFRTSAYCYEAFKHFFQPENLQDWYLFVF